MQHIMQYRVKPWQGQSLAISWIKFHRLGVTIAHE